MPHLVLADENPTTRRVFELALADEDLEVTCLDSAGATLEHLEQQPADILFAHVSLPDKSGYELSRRVKLNPPTASMTIVLLVGAFESFDEEKARDVGCAHHLSKPFETSALLQLVQELLANPPRLEVKRLFVFEIPFRAIQPETPVIELGVSRCSPPGIELEREIHLPKL